MGGRNTFLVGCGAGFGGDRLDAAGPVAAHLAASGAPAAIMFEALAERTLALAQRERAAGRPGYDQRLADRLRPILRTCLDAGVTIVGNFGAADPAGAAGEIRRLADEIGGRSPRVAVVTGDDLLAGPRRDRLAEAVAAAIPEGAIALSANAYMGAGIIAEAIAAGAEVVTTGRVADPALALGPLIAHFGWRMDDWDRLAAGTLAGHLLECGAQVSGGYFVDPGFKDAPDLHDVGFPFAEIEEDGTFVVSKPPRTGGVVSRKTVIEQMLYEIHDPAAYLTPDVVLDMTEVEVEEIGPDRVRVSGARGRPRPETLKATVCYEGDHLGEAEISYAGPNAAARARAALDYVRRRIDPALTWRADLIGVVSVHGDDRGAMLGRAAEATGEDVRLRVAVSAPTREAAALAVHDVGALYCCGPAGGAGVRMSVTPRIWSGSAHVPRELVEPAFEIIENLA